MGRGGTAHGYATDSKQRKRYWRDTKMPSINGIAHARNKIKQNTWRDRDVFFKSFVFCQWSCANFPVALHPTCRTSVFVFSLLFLTRSGDSFEIQLWFEALFPTLCIVTGRANIKIQRQVLRFGHFKSLA